MTCTLLSWWQFKHDRNAEKKANGMSSIWWEYNVSFNSAAHFQWVAHTAGSVVLFASPPLWGDFLTWDEFPFLKQYKLKTHWHLNGWILAWKLSILTTQSSESWVMFHSKHFAFSLYSQNSSGGNTLDILGTSHHCPEYGNEFYSCKKRKKKNGRTGGSTFFTNMKGQLRSIGMLTTTFILHT